jgi:uncharacterized membrane protein
VSETVDEQLGPIDYTVIELPSGARHFSGAVARELASLADAELIRVLDLVILAKDDAGDVSTLEFDQIEQPGDLVTLRPGLTEVLSPADLASLASAMVPGSTAGVLVWENTWATHLVLATEESGGRVLASGRIDTSALRAALSAGRRPARSHPAP